MQSLGLTPWKDLSPLPPLPALCSSPWASFPLSAHPFHHLLNKNPFYKELFQINGWNMLLISKFISRRICGKTAAPIMRVMIKYPIFSQLLLLLQTANTFQLTSKENFWYVLKTSPLPFIPISLIRLKTNNRKPSICVHINPVPGVLVTETEREWSPATCSVMYILYSSFLHIRKGRKQSRLHFLLNLCVITACNVLGNKSQNKGQNYRLDWHTVNLLMFSDGNWMSFCKLCISQNTIEIKAFKWYFQAILAVL